MISIVIPLYNKEKQIQKTLKSVLLQTYQDFEIVIVNDGSTDSSVQHVLEVKDKRIRLFHQENAGVSAARNKGIKKSKGDLIAFLDADDEWDPEYLQTQINLIQKYPQCHEYACNYVIKDMQGSITKTIINNLPFKNNDGYLTNYFEVASHSNPPLWTSTIVVRKSAIEDVGGFPIGIKSGEDLITWAKLAIKYQIAYNKKALASFLFDKTNFNIDQQSRKPENNDFIGQELQNLYINHPAIKGLKEYIALWHKMRSRIFLEKGFHFLAFKEALISAKFHLTYKIIVFMLMSFLPVNLVKKFFKL